MTDLVMRRPLLIMRFVYSGVSLINSVPISESDRDNGRALREFRVERKAVQPSATILTKTTRNSRGISIKLINWTAGHNFKQAFKASK